MDDWLEPGLRFLHYSVLLGLFGWAAFPSIGLRRISALPRFGLSSAAALGAAIAAPLLSILLMLASIAAMMGQGLAELDWPMVKTMVLDTDIGWAFLGRTMLLMLAFIAVLSRRRSVAALQLAALCYAAALMTLGWSGHAAATEAGLGLFHRLNNGVHVLAAGLWLGAIGWFLHLTIRAHRRPDRSADEQSLAAMHRFAPLGVGLVAVVAITGIVNAHLIFGIENSAEVAGTGYGVLLAVKIAMVGGMLAFGAHNAKLGRSYASRERIEACDPAAPLAALRRSLIAECGLAVGVIGLVAVLGMLSPTPMP